MLVLGPYGMPGKNDHNPLDVAYDNERRKLVLLRYIRASNSIDYQVASGSNAVLNKQSLLCLIDRSSKCGKNLP
jgi:hypothetical protein